MAIFSGKMTSRKMNTADVTWKHCSKVDPKDKNSKVNPKDMKKLKCNYCEKTVYAGIFRTKNHLVGTHTDVPCPQVPENVKPLFLAMLEKMQRMNLDSGDIFKEVDEHVTFGSGS